MAKISLRLEELTWQEAKACLEKNDLIILPIASVEQHGPALPLGTDSFNAAAVAQLAAEKTGVLVAPTVMFGVSHNHIDFCGTMTLRPDTLIAVIMDLVKSLHHHGFKRILLLNGHGGNNATIDVAAIQLRIILKNVLIGHAYIGTLDGGAMHQYSTSGIVYHADEGETSVALSLWPKLVKMTRAVRTVTPTFQSY
ncbi:MAG: creatininase family protein, partial [Deltaproteobacteria bacterium]|nr:creatininase family protein [Deltaproteobacteria bacterium]